MLARKVRPTTPPPAPVNGGMRWRSYYHELVDQYRSQPGYDFTDPDQPPAVETPSSSGQAATSGPGADRNEPAGIAPLITGTPPVEARVAQPYTYQPRASDGAVNGFTWYLEKSPSGMGIDRRSGEITWIPGEGGYVEVVGCARSLYGSTGRQRWTMCVRKAYRDRVGAINTRYGEALGRKKNRAGCGGGGRGNPPAAACGSSPPMLPVWREPRRRNRPALRAPPGIAAASRFRIAVPLRI